MTDLNPLAAQLNQAEPAEIASTLKWLGKDNQVAVALATNLHQVGVTDELKRLREFRRQVEAIAGHVRTASADTISEELDAALDASDPVEEA